MTMSQSTLIAAFSEEHVVRLTGLTHGQLRSWDRAGFFQPRYAYEDRHVPNSRVYSFQDVVGLRTIAVLMKEYKISLQKLRKVAEELVKRGYDHWADVSEFPGDCGDKDSDRRYSSVQRGRIFGRRNRQTVPDAHPGRCASSACPRRRTGPERVIGHNLMTDVLHA